MIFLTRVLVATLIIPFTSSKYLKTNEESHIRSKSLSTEEKNCHNYCDLFFQAQSRCPYASSSSHVPNNEDCVTSCLEASFSHDGTDEDFELIDTIQCRMNYAKMAIKEGPLTNSDHCLHATIPGPQRCTVDKESVTNARMLATGKQFFYYISATLEAGRIPVSQVFLIAISYLISLRGRLYVAYPYLQIDSESNEAIDCSSDLSSKYRTPDGTCNNFDMPLMGSTHTQFVHSLKPSMPHPDGYADVSAIAGILKRPHGQPKPEQLAPFNQLVSGWIQFMTHDWFQHDVSETSDDGVFHNTVTHWWDASQIYGSSAEEVEAIRQEDGKIHLDNNNELDYSNDGTPLTGFGDNFWVGLHVFHTLFAREHNYIVDELSIAYPDMSADEKYGAARLCVSAMLAKIHTVEWTPTLLDNVVSTLGLYINWYGLQNAISMFFSPEEIEPIKDTVNSIQLASVVGDDTFSTNLTLFNTSFFMTEEFVAVYRMHPLLPDEIDVDGETTLTLNQFSFKDARELVEVNTTKVFLKALATTPARTLSLRNYPYELYELKSPLHGNKKINLAEIDLMRDRERNLPRYNDARRQLLLEPYKSLDDLTDNKEELALLKSVYTDIEQVDFMVGCLVDKERPEGFAFGIVPYHIFVVMASRRIFSDRFFQEGMTADNYTPWGLEYVSKQSFRDIIIRHFPELSDAVPKNPFSNEWKL